MDAGLLLFAFTAGAAAFFAPCCVAMLPAYVGYVVGGSGGARAGPGARLGALVALGGLALLLVGAIPLAVSGLGLLDVLPVWWADLWPAEDRLLAIALAGVAVAVAGLLLAGLGAAAARGALFGLLATAGFLVLFLALGLPLAFLARGLASYLTWVAAAVGIALVVLGAFTLAGRSFAPSLPSIGADVTSARGYFVFGVGYGLASLSCTFPLFLGVMLAGLQAGGFASALAVFAAYALGKGALLVGTTVVTLAGGAGLAGRMRRFARHIELASGALLILAGLYVAWYFGRFALEDLAPLGAN